MDKLGSFPFRVKSKSQNFRSIQIFFFLPYLHKLNNINSFLYFFLKSLSKYYVVNLIITDAVLHKKTLNTFQELPLNIIILDHREPIDKQLLIFHQKFLDIILCINFSSPWFYNHLPLLKLSFSNLKIIDIVYNGVRLVEHLRCRNYIDLSLVQYTKLKKILIEANPTGKYLLNNFGINENLFCIDTIRPAPNRLKFGWIGRNSPEKRIEQFIKISHLYSDKADFELMTDASILLQERFMPEDSSLVLHIDKDDDFKLNWLKSLDVLVNTSEIEGLPISVLEAKALNLPLIAYDVGGISDMYTNLFDSILINQDSFFKLATSIKKIIGEPDLLTYFKENLLKNSTNLGLDYNFNILHKAINYVLMIRK